MTSMSVMLIITLTAKAYIKKHHHTVPNQYEYSKETLKELRKGLNKLKKASIYTQRIDWLFSSDDGEESFRRRLAEDLKELTNRK